MIPQPGQSELLLQGQVLRLAPLLPAVVLSPDCEAPLKKEGGLPEGPVLEALLCAETGEKKIELKEEEAIMDCQVGLPTPTRPGAVLPSLLCVLAPRLPRTCEHPVSIPPHVIFFWQDLLTCPATPDLCCAQNYLPK